jgi:CRISPR-associated endonuclease/helicase Cas3
MIVTFISRCNGKAINKTREILDAFAIRIGDFTWQTAITQEGLDAVYLSLKKSACKNTAVSCHKIKGKQITEVIWIVGSKLKFNLNGECPVNYTQKDFVLDYLDENIKHIYANSHGQNLSEHLFAVGFLSLLIINNLGIKEENIKECSFLSGALHDIGKVDYAFQKFIKKNIKNIDTPVDSLEDGSHIEDGSKVDGKKFSFETHPRHNEISLVLSESYLNNTKKEYDDHIYHSILYHHMKVLRKDQFDKRKVFNAIKKECESIDELYSLGQNVIGGVQRICESYNKKGLLKDNLYKRITNINKNIIIPPEGKNKSNFDTYKNYYECKDDIDKIKSKIKQNSINNILRSVLISSDRKISRESASDLSERIKNNEFEDLL